MTTSDFVFVCLPLGLLLIVWIARKKILPKWCVFCLNAIPMVIPLVLCICSWPVLGLTINKITELNPFLWGAYSFAIGFIEWLIDKYKELLPQTKESYEFNKRYSGIQNQWDLIKNENNDIDQKRMFIEESLRLLEDTITQHTMYYNKLSDSKLNEFAASVGALSKDYVHLCSNKNKFYNEIFASLYKYLFSEYKTNVLASIQPNSNDSSDLIIPEFVSNGLTQVIINNSDIIKYQYNTSVTTIKAFENNVKDGTELNGNNSRDFLRRIIITNEIDKPLTIDVSIFKRIVDWHKNSNVELRFISQAEVERKKSKYSTISRLDFSIIKMNEENRFFILEADRIKTRSIAGENHEMYSVKCISTQSRPDADKLFEELWKDAKIGEIQGTSVSFKNPNFNLTKQ